MQFWAKSRSCPATWAKRIHKTHKQQGRASLTHARSERHIFTHTVGQHMARTTQEGAASLKNNENSTAVWCCTAGRGSTTCTRLRPAWWCCSLLTPMLRAWPRNLCYGKKLFLFAPKNREILICTLTRTVHPNYWLAPPGYLTRLPLFHLSKWGVLIYWLRQVSQYPFWLAVIGLFPDDGLLYKVDKQAS